MYERENKYGCVNIILFTRTRVYSLNVRSSQFVGREITVNNIRRYRAQELILIDAEIATVRS